MFKYIKKVEGEGKRQRGRGRRKREGEEQEAWVRVSKTVPGASEHALQSDRHLSLDNLLARLGLVPRWPPTGPAEQGRELLLNAEYHCCPINDLSVQAATFAAAEGPWERGEVQWGEFGRAIKTEAKGESQAQSRFQAANIWGTVRRLLETHIHPCSFTLQGCLRFLEYLSC